MQRAKERGQHLRVGEILLARRLPLRAHVGQIRAGAKIRSVAGQHQHAHAGILGQLGERGGQLGDQRLGESILRFGTREDEPRDATLLCVPNEGAHHIRKTPNVVSGIGASCTAASVKPSTSRVRRGSITPSSHRRAVE